MPGFPWGLAGHLTLTKSHVLGLCIDIWGGFHVTCPRGAVGQNDLCMLCRAFLGDLWHRKCHSKDTRTNFN